MPSPLARPVELRALPPAEAIRYFESKGYRIGFSWADVWREEHARAFTIAKMMRLDLLESVRQELDTAIRDGTTREEFVRTLRPRLEAAGWWGLKEEVDPLTGELRQVQLGSVRRLNLIFDVNLRTAYQAGKWERMERLKRRRPFLAYSAVLDDRTRPHHAAWGGRAGNRIILPMDHPWWDTHYPPNGWRCRCSVIQLSQRDLDKRGWTVSPDPEITYRGWRNFRTGEVTRVPTGIDPGWDYNVGKAHMRGLVPPPLDGAPPVPTVPPAGSLPALPVDQVRAGRIMPAGLSDREYVRRFMASFGTTPEKPVVFIDKLGEPVVISDDLFRYSSTGNFKLGKGDRKRHLLMLADTIRDPHEIWWVWMPSPRDPGKFILRRRYIRLAQVQGRDVPLFTVFEVGKDGWTGVTAFTPDKAAHLEKQRRSVAGTVATLAWQRPKK